MEEKQNNESSSFISWDIDTTGRRLIDEMCHLGAYSKPHTFNQYIMPYRDIDYGSRKRHLLKTINIGVYRVLRETSTGKILKTKSEVSALADFINWLEQRKTECGHKVMLLYYETFTPAPFILIESLKKYDLLERFKEFVGGFANAFEFIKAKCETSMQTYSIKNLAKILLDKEYKKPHDAFERAQILFEIVSHLSVGESQSGLDDLSVALKDHTSTIEVIEEKIADLKLTLKKQNSLKPIFGPIIKYDKKRRQAITLRRHLINAQVEYEALQSNKEDISSFLKEKLSSDVNESDINELISLINKHFSNETDNTEEKSRGNAKGNEESLSNRSHPRRGGYRNRPYRFSGPRNRGQKFSYQTNKISKKPPNNDSKTKTETTIPDNNTASTVVEKNES
ncbi:hypothetical protein O3M35_004381 [Rhynocoris fuscipes]|uniref:Exuperantia RNAse H-like domain-containing protein n=1 Tax=Rhynocoris fuscipes TaxID=488301 RepID=A0AAW1CJT0_9HEMI